MNSWAGKGIAKQFDVLWNNDEPVADGNSIVGTLGQYKKACGKLILNKPSLTKIHEKVLQATEC